MSRPACTIHCLRSCPRVFLHCARPPTGQDRRDRPSSEQVEMRQSARHNNLPSLVDHHAEGGQRLADECGTASGRNADHRSSRLPLGLQLWFNFKPQCEFSGDGWHDHQHTKLDEIEIRVIQFYSKYGLEARDSTSSLPSSNSSAEEMWRRDVDQQIKTEDSYLVPVLSIKILTNRKQWDKIFMKTVFLDILVWISFFESFRLPSLSQFSISVSFKFLNCNKIRFYQYKLL